MDEQRYEQRHKGEVALVTGANKGIGYEIVRRLASEGMTVYLGARDEERGGRAERELAGPAADVRFLRLDVTDPAQVEAAAKHVGEESGRLDVLVNNAGIVAEWGFGVAEVTVQQMRRTYDVNVFGAMAVTHACLPLLRRSARARVVNLSSQLGSLRLLADPDSPVSAHGMLAYGSSKCALNAVTVLYANALREEGIRVNAANPGFVATDLNDHRGVLSVEEGAAVPVALALLGPGGPSGTFRGADGSAEETVPW
jgi:NAD(P)-dependent dehydrogenase (short-subunit alcohol dehydrogenase family)